MTSSDMLDCEDGSTHPLVLANITSKDLPVQPVQHAIPSWGFRSRFLAAGFALAVGSSLVLLLRFPLSKGSPSATSSFRSDLALAATFSGAELVNGKDDPANSATHEALAAMAPFFKTDSDNDKAAAALETVGTSCIQLAAPLASFTGGGSVDVAGTCEGIALVAQVIGQLANQERNPLVKKVDAFYQELAAKLDTKASKLRSGLDKPLDIRSGSKVAEMEDLFEKIEDKYQQYVVKDKMSKPWHGQLDSDDLADKLGPDRLDALIAPILSASDNDQGWRAVAKLAHSLLRARVQLFVLDISKHAGAGVLGALEASGKGLKEALHDYSETLRSNCIYPLDFGYARLAHFPPECKKQELRQTAAWDVKYMPESTADTTCSPQMARMMWTMWLMKDGIMSAGPISPKYFGRVKDLNRHLTKLLPECSHDLEGQIEDLPPTLTTLAINASGVRGEIKDLPKSLQDLTVYPGSSLSGSLQDLPPSVTRVYINNSIDFCFKDVPASVQKLEGWEASGHFKDLSQSVTTLFFHQGKRVSGALKDLPRGVHMLHAPLAADVVGRLKDLPAKVSEVVLTSAKEISGSLEDLPHTLTRLDLKQAKGISGSLGELAKRKHLSILNVASASGVKGDLSKATHVRKLYVSKAAKLFGKFPCAEVYCECLAYSHADIHKKDAKPAKCDDWFPAKPE